MTVTIKDYIPKYIKQTLIDPERAKVTHTRWNELWNLNIAQGDYHAEVLDLVCKALEDDYLKKSNAEVFTPSGDYEPATKKYVDDAVISAGGYNDEQAQDAVGAILTDTDSIAFNYDDLASLLSAEVKVDEDTLVVDTTNHCLKVGPSVWTADNDGTNSGLDADLVRGRNLIGEFERLSYDNYLRTLELYYTGHFTGPGIAGMKGMTFDGFQDLLRVENENIKGAEYIADTTAKQITTKKSNQFYYGNTIVYGAGTTGFTHNDGLVLTDINNIIDQNLTNWCYIGLGKAGKFVIRIGLTEAKEVNKIIIRGIGGNYTTQLLARMAYSNDDITYTTFGTPDIRLTYDNPLVVTLPNAIDAKYFAFEFNSPGVSGDEYILINELHFAKDHVVPVVSGILEAIPSIGSTNHASFLIDNPDFNNQLSSTFDNISTTGVNMKSNDGVIIKYDLGSLQYINRVDLQTLISGGTLPRLISINYSTDGVTYANTGVPSPSPYNFGSGRSTFIFNRVQARYLALFFRPNTDYNKTFMFTDMVPMYDYYADSEFKTKKFDLPNTMSEFTLHFTCNNVGTITPRISFDNGVSWSAMTQKSTRTDPLVAGHTEKTYVFSPSVKKDNVKLKFEMSPDAWNNPCILKRYGLHWA